MKKYIFLISFLSLIAQEESDSKLNQNLRMLTERLDLLPELFKKNFAVPIESRIDHEEEQELTHEDYFSIIFLGLAANEAFSGYDFAKKNGKLCVRKNSIDTFKFSLASDAFSTFQDAKEREWLNPDISELKALRLCIIDKAGENISWTYEDSDEEEYLPHETKFLFGTVKECLDAFASNKKTENASVNEIIDKMKHFKAFEVHGNFEQ